MLVQLASCEMCKMWLVKCDWLILGLSCPYIGKEKWGMNGKRCVRKWDVKRKQLSCAAEGNISYVFHESEMNQKYDEIWCFSCIDTKCCFHCLLTKLIILSTYLHFVIRLKSWDGIGAWTKVKHLTIFDEPVACPHRQSHEGGGEKVCIRVSGKRLVYSQVR